MDKLWEGRVTYSNVHSFPVLSLYAANPTIATPMSCWIFFKNFSTVGPDFLVAALWWKFMRKIIISKPSTHFLFISSGGSISFQDFAVSAYCSETLASPPNVLITALTANWNCFIHSGSLGVRPVFAMISAISFLYRCWTTSRWFQTVPTRTRGTSSSRGTLLWFPYQV
jgi:hypothetical protein